MPGGRRQRPAPGRRQRAPSYDPADGLNFDPVTLAPGAQEHWPDFSRGSRLDAATNFDLCAGGGGRLRESEREKEKREGDRLSSGLKKTGNPQPAPFSLPPLADPAPLGRGGEIRGFTSVAFKSRFTFLAVRIYIYIYIFFPLLLLPKSATLCSRQPPPNFACLLVPSER